MNDTDTATLVREMMTERQRLLISEANHLRGLLGLPPIAGVEGGPPDRCGGQSPGPGGTFALTRSRRAVIAAMAGCIARGETTTYGTLRIRSGVAQRTFARAIAWAVGAEVVARAEGGYVPGPAWAACVEGDAELLGLVPREVMQASGATSRPTRRSDDVAPSRG